MPIYPLLQKGMVQAWEGYTPTRCPKLPDALTSILASGILFQCYFIQSSRLIQIIFLNCTTSFFCPHLAWLLFLSLFLYFFYFFLLCSCPPPPFYLLHYPPPPFPPVFPNVVKKERVDQTQFPSEWVGRLCPQGGPGSGNEFGLCGCHIIPPQFIFTQGLDQLPARLFYSSALWEQICQVKSFFRKPLNCS